MWRGSYRASLASLAVLDEDERLVARGGQQLHVSGGFLPAADPRATGYERVFSVSYVLLANRSTDGHSGRPFQGRLGSGARLKRLTLT
jgi:hypothetical protein